MEEIKMIALSKQRSVSFTVTELLQYALKEKNRKKVKKLPEGVTN